MEKFAAIDSDGDGKISFAEYSRYIERVDGYSPLYDKVFMDHFARYFRNWQV